MVSERKAILQTLAYFDIFNYPTTFKELYRFLPFKISEKKLKESLINFEKVGKKGKYYFLKKSGKAIANRKEREFFSKKKFSIAKKICSILSIIPTVYLIGISGALAMNNCKENDDIDLFLITKRKTIWSTRLLVLLILQFLGKRRKKNEKNTKNKICVNLFLDEDNLYLSKRRQNLYGAHEIVQMVPLFERKNAYNRFIIANGWIFSFLPNASPKKVFMSKKDNFFGLVIQIIEPLSMFVQKKYMREITKEEVSNNILAFHPIDYQSKVIQSHKKKLKALI